VSWFTTIPAADILSTPGSRSAVPSGPGGSGPPGEAARWWVRLDARRFQAIFRVYGGRGKTRNLGWRKRLICADQMSFRIGPVVKYIAHNQQHRPCARRQNWKGRSRSGPCRAGGRTVEFQEIALRADQHTRLGADAAEPLAGPGWPGNWASRQSIHGQRHGSHWPFWE